MYTWSQRSCAQIGFFITPVWLWPDAKLSLCLPLVRMRYACWHLVNTRGLHAGRNHTLFVYMEDDLELTWSALEAWAYDESLLAPMGFHRGFVRVETAQWNGDIMALDQTEPVSVTLDDSRVLSIAISVPAEHVHISGDMTANFVRLQSSYMAMWLGSHSQVAEWFQAPEWNARLNGHGGLIREDAARNLYTIDNNQFRRKEHESSLMVPFSPRTVTVF